MHAISVVSVDLQNEFFDIRRDQVGRLEKAFCLPGSRRLIQHARLKKHQVVHLVTGHKGTDTLPIHLTGQAPYCLEGSEGAQSVRGLLGEGDLIVQKTQFSGFFGTSLDQHLSGYDSVILCGIATDCCILQTAFDASNHRKRVYIPYQGVSATTRDAYIFGLQTIAKSAGAIIDLEAFLREPDRPASRLTVGQIQDLAGGWYSAQIERLNNFRARHPELFASPMPAPEELVASLEAFLSVGAAP